MRKVIIDRLQFGYFETKTPKPAEQKKITRPVSPIRLSPFGRKGYASPRSKIDDPGKRFSRTPTKSYHKKRMATEQCDKIIEKNNQQTPIKIEKRMGLFQQISYISNKATKNSELSEEKSKSKLKNRRPIFEGTPKVQNNKVLRTEKKYYPGHQDKENDITSFLTENLDKQKHSNINQKNGLEVGEKKWQRMEEANQNYSDIKFTKVNNERSKTGVQKKMTRKQNEESFSEIINLIKKAQKSPLNYQKQSSYLDRQTNSHINMCKSPSNKTFFPEENKIRKTRPEQSFSDVVHLIQKAKKKPKILEEYSSKQNMNKHNINKKKDLFSVFESLTMSPYLE